MDFVHLQGKMLAAAEQGFVGIAGMIDMPKLGIR